jgi:hypothetical protein
MRRFVQTRAHTAGVLLLLLLWCDGAFRAAENFPNVFSDGAFFDSRNLLTAYFFFSTLIG